MSAKDKDYYNMSVSISKALNPLEAPLKVKHARAAIICTHRTHGAQSFWSVILQQPLMENRFIAWKFCHLLHKVLRDGHSKSILDSQRHKKMILEIGKLWGHLHDGLGICIQYYAKFLVYKLGFHERFQRLPGNLVLPFPDLERFSGSDINFYFQFGVEIFDYMDEILALQLKIFTSVNSFRMTSMTPQGQCRLAPIIPLVQDSNQLYDFAVRIMFKLHASLPNDVLAGHRERFSTMFSQLKTFYDNVRPLQYFADLIQVPKLPENAPNFSSKVDFGSYIPPTVVVPEPEPDPIVDNLVDMSAAENAFSSESPQSRSSDSITDSALNFERLLQERDNLIRELHAENENLRKQLKTMTIQHRELFNDFEEKMCKLGSDLTIAQENLTEMRRQKEELESKTLMEPTLEQQTSADAERLKLSEDKFQKLKLMYAQIRDEHVKLLRQHGDVSKQFTTLQNTTKELAADKEHLKFQLEEIQQKDLQVQQYIEKISALDDKNEEVTLQYEQLKHSQNNLQFEKSVEISGLHIKVANLENEKQIVSEKLNAELDKLKNDLVRRIDDCVKLEESDKILINQKDVEIKNLTEMIARNEETLQTTCSSLERLKEEKVNIESELQQLHKEQNILNEKHRIVLDTINVLETNLQDSKKNNVTSLEALLRTCIKTSESIASRAANEKNFTTSAGISSYYLLIAENLQENLNEMKLVYEKYELDRSGVEELAAKTVLAGHLMAIVQIQGMTICNLSSDIEYGERIANKLSVFSENIGSLFSVLQTCLIKGTAVKEEIQNVKKILAEISSMIEDLNSKSGVSAEQIGDEVELELASMERAIEEAASKIVEMLSKSKDSVSGLKLEVNEKILDSCTNLMQCIRILVQKSRLLQAEIVTLGRGSASAKEFFKRNHQWTEGLISAAKSVAQGANMLVIAADKAVTGESKHHFDLIVAAQGIAAYTAQLVVASRVKAESGSQNLQGLKSASKNVTEATGKVVAIAKDCSKKLEDFQDLDLSKLTVHQAKTVEMEIQVKVLELEQSLQMERLKLAAFRRQNYQNPD